MKNTNYTLIPQRDYENLKKRIHNQRDVINRQGEKVKNLTAMTGRLSYQLNNATDNEIFYESEISDLVDRYNKLAKQNEDLQESENQHKRQLVAVNHAVNGKIHVALR